MMLKHINIGDKVLYIPPHLLLAENGEMILNKNLGTVASKNDKYVFVKFNGNINLQATKAVDLYSLEHRQDLQDKIK